jgi:UDP-N-acetyl-D-glucosamine dehydrogenase
VDELEELDLRSVAYEPEAYDAVVIVTDHSGIDYAELTERAGVVIDFRNATGAAGKGNGRVWKL